RDVAARDDEHALFARPDGDVGALLDHALLDHLAALHQPDAQHLGAGDLRHRPHHGGHLPGPIGLDLLLRHSEGLRRTLARSWCSVTGDIPKFPGAYTKVAISVHK